MQPNGTIVSFMDGACLTNAGGRLVASPCEASGKGQVFKAQPSTLTKNGFTVQQDGKCVDDYAKPAPPRPTPPPCVPPACTPGGPGCGAPRVRAALGRRSGGDHPGLSGGPPPWALRRWVFGVGLGTAHPHVVSGAGRGAPRRCVASPSPRGRVAKVPSGSFLLLPCWCAPGHGCPMRAIPKPEG